jgi:prepilin-type processing-associated H-X9-DG protein
MKYKWHNNNIELPNRESERPVKIVGDGSIANVLFADGRLIPVLIIDTSTRPDIVDLVKVQEEQPPGDVKSIWGRVSKSKKYISLILVFERPSHTVVVLEFDITKQGILVESILTAQALYLQPGQPGDKVSSTRANSSIIVEIPDMGFREVWNKLFQHELEIYYRTNGLNRTMSREAAKNTISETRKFAKLRISKS